MSENFMPVKDQINFIDIQIRETNMSIGWLENLADEFDLANEEQLKTEQLKKRYFEAIRDTLLMHRRALGDLLNDMKQEVLEDA